jgi:excisionase family DNA binding protein
MCEIPGSAAAPARSVFVEEAATLLGVSRRTIYYRIREGKLRTIHTRCGSQRILTDSIEELRRAAAAKQAARRTSRSEAEPLPFEIKALA